MCCPRVASGNSYRYTAMKFTRAMSTSDITGGVRMAATRTCLNPQLICLTEKENLILPSFTATALIPWLKGGRKNQLLRPQAPEKRKSPCHSG